MKNPKTFNDFMNQVNEIFLVTPTPKRKSSSTATKSASKPKMGKPDPKDPNYVEKMRKWAKQQQEETSVSEDMEQRLAIQAKEREEYRKEREARRKAREEKNRQRSEVSRKGVPFYDKQGEGYIKGGVKTYTKRN